MNLKQKIREKLNEQNLSVAALEKKAGLKMSAVRNILRGQTRKPSAYTLKKISDALNCKIDDLLVEDHINNNKFFYKYERQKIPIKFEEPELFAQIGEAVIAQIQNRSLDITLDQFLKIIKESYSYAVKKEPKKIDPRFIEWMIDKMI